MQVLHVIPCLDAETGGPARSVPGLCQALGSAGLDISLYALRRRHASVAEATEKQAFKMIWGRPLLESRQFPRPGFYHELKRSLHSFDLVHLHSVWNPVISLAALACRETRRPYVLSPMGMLQRVALSRRAVVKRVYYFLWDKRTVSGAAAVHFLSAYEAQESVSFRKYYRSSFVIPNGIDPDLAARTRRGVFRRAYPFLEEKRIVLFLGRLHWSKGLGLQAETIERVLANSPNVMWVLIGPDLGEWGRLQRWLRRKSIAKHVFWAGARPWEECLAALADADVFLLTSRHEAHSNAMNEALAVGTPVVASMTVGCEEIQTSGAGRLVANDSGALAQAVCDVLNDQKGSDAMREAGRRLVTERLAWSHVARSTITAYRQVTG